MHFLNLLLYHAVSANARAQVREQHWNIMLEEADVAHDGLPYACYKAQKSYTSQRYKNRGGENN